MKKSKVLLLLLVFVIVTSQTFAGGSSQGSAGAGPTPLSIMHTGRPSWEPTLPGNQELMKRTNTVLDVTYIASPDQRNLVFASGDLPDIIGFANLDFQQYISTGYLRPLDDLLPTHGQDLLKNTSKTGWDLMTIQGKKYAYPYEANQVKLYSYVRVDWLKNVGIDLSKNADYGTFGGKVVTLDQYKDILVKFTTNDPDKNGKNDTYGLGSQGPKTIAAWSNICGAFGGIPGQYYINNNVAIPWVVTDQFRAALQYINSLWAAGAIDPESYLNTADDGKAKLINSVTGGDTGVWWSNAHTNMIDGLYKNNPDAEYIPLLITSNDGKLSGAPNNGVCTSTYSITTKSKVPERAMDFINFLNTDEGFYFAWYGLLGTDFNMVNGYPIRTDSGLEEYNKMILDTLFPMSNRLDLQVNAAKKQTTNWSELQRQKWEILQCDNTQPNYINAFYGIPNPKEYDEYGVDVNNWIEQSTMSFITGETPLNDANWTNYINTWKRMGGVKILNGYINAYNNLKGSTITAGITE